MKLKRLGGLGSAFVLSISTLLTIGFTGIAHASPLTCTWTGATNNNFSNAGNWTGCNSAAPISTDNLVFDNTSLANNAVLNDDITGVTFGSITFQGTGSNNNGYTITSTNNYTLSLSGGITDTTSDAYSNIVMNMAFTTNSTISVSANFQYLNLGTNSGPAYTLTLGSNNLTLSGTGVDNYLNVVGSGEINITSSGSFWSQNTPSTGFTGTIDVQQGNLGLDSNSSSNPSLDYFPNATGITVASGAYLSVSDEFTTSPANVTLVEPLTLAGNGPDQCVVTGISGYSNCGAVNSDLGVNSKLTLTGAIVLTANTQLNSLAGSDSIIVNGPLSGDFSVQNAYGDLVLASSNNTSGTTNGTYTAGGVLVSSSGSAAPKTPDTGSALTSANIELPLIGSLMIAGGIFYSSRKLKHPIATKRR